MIRPFAPFPSCISNVSFYLFSSSFSLISDPFLLPFFLSSLSSGQTARLRFHFKTYIPPRFLPFVPCYIIFPPHFSSKVDISLLCLGSFMDAGKKRNGTLFHIQSLLLFFYDEREGTHICAVSIDCRRLVFENETAGHANFDK